MSLTSLLEPRTGPARQLMERRLPNLSAVRDAWKAAGPPTILPAGDRPPWGYLGAAFDYRLRLFLTVTAPSAYVAASGARLLAAAQAARLPDDRGRRRYMDAQLNGSDSYGQLAAALSELVARTDPVGRLLNAADEQLLCRYCYLLAVYEAAFRVARFDTNPLFGLGPTASIDDQLALVTEAAADDLVALTHGFAAIALPSWSARPVIANPVFAGSSDVGGADADLIVDTTLFEVKTTKNAAPRREWVYQLLGYVLLDYADTFGIDSVGFYISRAPAVVSWPLAELLPALAGAPLDIAELRAEFRAAIPARPARASRTVAAGPRGARR